jgi:hypothetical protein
MTGVLLTLAPSLPVIIAGLALLCTGVFIAQTASQQPSARGAPPRTRVTAAGLYTGSRGSIPG